MVRKNQLDQFNSQGILRCARYALMPNKLRLCGPEDNQNFLAYCQAQKVDRGLSLILEKFQTLYPYLKFIAQANRIRDPFDERVIEAYWIGNYLLENIRRPSLYYHLIDGLHLKKRLNQKLLKRVIDKIPLGAKPHHNFHVFNVWKRTGHLDIMHTLSSMDLCRVSWGRIEEIKQTGLRVSYQPLVFENDQLQLGSEVIQEISYQINDQGFIDQPEVGQSISFHWGFACEVLGNLQIAYLKKYTQENIQLANLS